MVDTVYVYQDLEEYKKNTNKGQTIGKDALNREPNPNPIDNPQSIEPNTNVKPTMSGTTRKKRIIEPIEYKEYSTTRAPTTAELMKIKDISQRNKNLDKTTNLNPDYSKTTITTVSPAIDYGRINDKGEYEPTNPDIKAPKYVPDVTVSDYEEVTETPTETITKGYSYKKYELPTEKQVVTIETLPTQDIQPISNEETSTKILNFVPEQSYKLAKKLKIGEIKPKRVIVAEKKFFEGGTSAYDVSSKDYYLPKPKTNKIKNVTYVSQGVNIAPFLISAGATALVYSFTPAEIIAIPSAVSGFPKIVRGARKGNVKELSVGVLEASPALIFGVGSAYNYLTKPVYETRTTLYPRGSAYSGENVEGNIGYIKPLRNKYEFSIAAGNPNPDVLIERTSRLRKWLKLEPSETELIKDMSYIDVVIGQTDTKGFAFAMSAGKGVNLNTGTETTGEYWTGTTSKTIKITPEEISANRQYKILARDLERQFGIKVGDSSYDLFISQTQPSYSYGLKPNKVTSTELIAVQKNPTIITKEGNIVTGGDNIFNAKVVSSNKKLLSKEYGSYNFAVEEAQSSDDMVRFMTPSGKKSGLQFGGEVTTQQVAEATSAIPKFKVMQDQTITNVFSSYEATPTMVGGLGKEVSIFFGQGGGLKSNEDITTSGFNFKLPTNTNEIIQVSTEPAIKVKSKVKDVIDNNTPIIIDIVKSGKRTNEITKPIDIVIETPIEAQTPTQSQKLRLDTRQDFKITNPFRPTPKNPSTIVPKMPKFNTNQNSLYSKVRNAFDVFVFNKGREEKIASGLPENKAKLEGFKAVVSNLRASFKLKSRGTTTIEDVSFKLPTTFRVGKYDKMRFVQKKEARFGSRGETKEAQFFRKVRKGKIKWF